MVAGGPAEVRLTEPSGGWRYGDLQRVLVRTDDEASPSTLRAHAVNREKIRRQPTSARSSKAKTACPFGVGDT